MSVPERGAAARRAGAGTAGRRAGRRRRVALAALAAIALLALVRAALTGGASAPSADGAEPGGIAVREAAVRRMPTAWLLDARADIELPPSIRTGLDSGVPLEFVLELSLSEPRVLRPDRRVLAVERRYGLVYYELTRHYQVRSFDDGTARNYRSLPTALGGLGTLRGVPLAGTGAATPSATAVTVPRTLRAALVLRLDEQALPLPLQSPFGSAWRLTSGAYAWVQTGERAGGRAGGRTDGWADVPALAPAAGMAVDGRATRSGERS